MADTATYIYCLVEQSRRPKVAQNRKTPAGLPGATHPELLEIGKSLWAIAADVPLKLYGPAHLEERLRDLEWVADIALAHESTVEHFARAKTAAVVPMKLFTMFSSRERAIDDLRARRPELTAVLTHIRGAAEWGVRIVRHPAAGRARTTSKPAHATGTEFLAARKREREQARAAVVKAAEAAETAFEQLSKLARSSRRRQPPEGATTPPLVDAAFLVKTSAAPRFRAAIKRQAALCRKAGAELILTGPWPAYNFVQQDGAST